MSKCNCRRRARIVSDVVQNMGNGQTCDVCTTPICGEPKRLSIYAPVVYDEIGINLCTTFDIPDTFPTATSASAKVLGLTYTYGTDNVEVTQIPGRSNCYTVSLSNITVQFAISLYDANCTLLGTVFPTAVYLPSDTTAPTYDEDTNPSGVELEIFAPYGITYDATGLTPVINNIGLTTDNNSLQQGINLFGIAKLLDYNQTASTVTVGLTLVLQSVYFSGYMVFSEGKIDVPKGSIISPENSDCMRFVAGDLLDLEIKPLDLGAPYFEENLKRDIQPNCAGCSGMLTTNGSNG